MTIFGLIERNVALRKLSSILTALSVAIGVMLVCAILKVRDELSSTYRRQSEGYSIVVGPPGSRLEVVLNAVYHVGQSTGFVPFSLYNEFISERWQKFTKLAVPYAVGDSFRGFRVVASTDAVFDPVFPFPASSTVEGKFAAGRPYHFGMPHLEEALEGLRRAAAARASGRPASAPVDDHDHDHKEGEGHDHADVNEAVLGAAVAEELGLAVGALIEPTHGVEGGKDHSHDHAWTVVGILKPTGTPIDRVVFTNIDSFYRIAEHQAGVIAGTNEPGLSAILLFPVDAYKPAVIGQLTKRTDLTVAEVAFEIAKLLKIVGNVDQLFLFVAVLVVVLGVASILVAIYNTMNERRREVAIMRALGARRSMILVTIVGEAAMLALGGALVGLILTRILLAAARVKIEASSGLRIEPWSVLPLEFAVVGLVLVVGALAGLIPAAKAYRTDVARHLAPLS